MDIETIKKEMQLLIDTLNDATESYNEGKPFISDIEWDFMYFTLKKMEDKVGFYLPGSPVREINFTTVDKLEKITHNHPMLSLDKTKDWNEFLNYFYDIDSSKDVIGMVKLDGLTCSLKYLNGNLISAETRGNGEVGENILHNAQIIPSIPNKITYKEELIIDGEIICTYSDFESFSSEYKNPRNFAAGAIRLLDSSECAKRKLTFVAWNVVKGFEPENFFLNKLQKLEDLGFLVTPYTSSFDWDAKDFLQDQAKECGYPIDGLVGRFDDINFGESLGATGHHPRAAYAFKFYDETYGTTLKNIEWTMGRTGVLTPVAVFDPVDIDGSTVERASLHNISVAKETLGNYPHIGQQIDVFKANMIIPQIYNADKGYYSSDLLYLPTKCPVCGELVLIEKENETQILVCKNPNCEGKLINQLDHFVGKKGLDIKGLSKQTLEKLINLKWISELKDIFFLKDHRTEWIKQPGFGAKSVDNILNAIENAKNCELSNFITSIGIPLVGTAISNQLTKMFETWDDFIKAIDEKFDFSSEKDFGPELSKKILDFDFTKAKEIATYLVISNSNYTKVATISDELSGLTFVITGKLKHFSNREELKANIIALGGKVSDTVNTDTSYLINNDITSKSAKNQKAKKFSIDIITEQEFIEKFQNNLTV